MSKLIHPELSYAVRGVLFDVHNRLGPGLKEEYYRDAVAIGLEAEGMACQVEKDFEVYYEGERVGLYYVDVWVAGGKILLELKVAPAIEPVHKAQAISYLKVSDADLAIVAAFGASLLDDERLPNYVRDRRAAFSWQPRAAGPELLRYLPDQGETRRSLLLLQHCEELSENPPLSERTDNEIRPVGLASGEEQQQDAEKQRKRRGASSSPRSVQNYGLHQRDIYNGRGEV